MFDLHSLTPRRLCRRRTGGGGRFYRCLQRWFSFFECLCAFSRVENTVANTLRCSRRRVHPSGWFGRDCFAGRSGERERERERTGDAFCLFWFMRVPSRLLRSINGYIWWEE